MRFLTWDETLSVGVEEIDAEHKRMVEIVTAMRNSMIAGMNDDCFTGMFDSLVDCTVMHFDHEDKLMVASHYPFIDRHRREHELLKRRLTLFREDVTDRSDAERSRDMMEFLKLWLIEHLHGEDKELGLYLQSRNPVAA